MTLTFRAVLLAVIGLVPIVLFPGWVPLLVWLGVVIVLVGVDVAFAASPRHIEIVRNVPRSVRLEDTAEATLRLTNHGSRLLRGVVKDAWQPSAGAVGNVARVRIPAGEVRSFVYTLTPSRRGDIGASHVSVRALGPLGLAGQQTTIKAPGVLQVLPLFRSKRLLPSKLKLLHEIDSRASVNVRGQGTEFDSLREYVRGDDVRSIDWRATARSRDVVVRTWRPERDRRVIIVLDTSRTSAARIMDEQRLDTGIEAALLLAALAERGGDRVDFVAFDRRVRSRVQSTMKMATLNHLGSAMSGLTSELVEADWNAMASEALRLSKQRSFVVLLTALDTGAVREGLLPVLPALTARHTVAVASVRDPELDARLEDEDSGYAASRTGAHTKSASNSGARSGIRERGTDRASVTRSGPGSGRGPKPTDVYRIAALERAVLERVSLATLIRQTGAEVVDAPPYDLPSALVDLYLRLKAAGRL